MSQGSSDSIYSSLLCRECMLSPVGCYCTARVSPELEQSRCNPRTLAEDRPPRSQERLRHTPWARGRQFKCLTRRLKLSQEKGAGTRTAARAPGDARLQLTSNVVSCQCRLKPRGAASCFRTFVDRQGARGGPGMTAAHGAPKVRSGQVYYSAKTVRELTERRCPNEQRAGERHGYGDEFRKFWSRWCWLR